MTVEIELKLALAPVQAARLKRHALLAGADRPLRRWLVSVYFDTPGLDLMRAQAALRVRRVGRGWVQTVKIGGGSAGGLHQRPEWETPVAGAVPEPGRFDTPAVKALLTPGRVVRLRPLFQTRFWRTAWTLPVSGGGSIEVALDQGEVSSGGRSQPICEVELELKSGQPAALYDLALALAADFDLRPDPVSKAGRGYALFQNLHSQPLQAAPVGLKPEMRVADACVAVMQSGLGQFTANLAGLIHETDPEYLHQARVAVRRLRSALSVFAPALPDPALASLREELRWLMGALGPARDWDVFATETLPPLMAAMPGRPLASLARDGAAQRDEARAAMTAAVSSRRLTRLLLETGRVLLPRPWEQAVDRIGSAWQSAPVTALAESVLDRRQRQLLRRGRHFSRLAPAARHRLRVAAKKQRYTAEFFAELYPRKAARAYIKNLAALQDGLGALNDIAVTGRLLDGLRGGRAARRAWACGVVQGWVESRARARIAELESAWRRMKKIRPFWSKPT
ncbi:inorganic triphosphatase [Sulfuriferula plumbiphila]|uniref:Inorganic triphosphatase n=1 Tax=Sulfuriferula plumbiphila TaxID=171865 RepID=A0A512LAL0_9PROT|nr:CYTH and CHAD domain-containing protein [Sulfuriferula plumbiphila]BBP03395.1 inorganic triphosphatase [Sulfuriferula plumbiphila]GEP31523.1 inorganic triphosphatase [Sulfuriferula plumbiphila]